MLRWFSRARKDNRQAREENAEPGDEWAFLRSRPDFDADEMASVRSQGAAETAPAHSREAAGSEEESAAAQAASGFADETKLSAEDRMLAEMARKRTSGVSPARPSGVPVL